MAKKKSKSKASEATRKRPSKRAPTLGGKERQFYEVAKYPRDPNCSETVKRYRMDDVCVRHVLALRGDILDGWASLCKPWEHLNDDGAMERLSDLVDEYLMRRQDRSEEELRGWAIDRLLRELRKAIDAETTAINSKTRQELDGAFRAGFNPDIRKHWQSQAREAMLRVRSYRDSLQKGEVHIKAPMPFMHRTPTYRMKARGYEPPVKIPPEQWRFPSIDDTPWRYLCLGLKLEGLWGEKDIFIPEDVLSMMKELRDFIEDAVYAKIGGIISGGMWEEATASLEDLKTWWGSIEQDLRSEAPADDCGGSDGDDKSTDHAGAKGPGTGEWLEIRCKWELFYKCKKAGTRDLLKRLVTAPAGTPCTKAENQNLRDRLKDKRGWDSILPAVHYARGNIRLDDEIARVKSDDGEKVVFLVRKKEPS